MPEGLALPKRQTLPSPKQAPVQQVQFIMVVLDHKESLIYQRRIFCKWLLFAVVCVLVSESMLTEWSKVYCIPAGTVTT